MTAKTNVAHKYLAYLEQGDTQSVIDLFTASGIVDSPLYGVQKATAFYKALSNDTSTSELFLKGIFEQPNTNDLALYFTYKWTLQNKEVVTFDVVDIIELDSNNKIKKLKIIYDTVIARELVSKLTN